MVAFLNVFVDREISGYGNHARPWGSAVTAQRDRTAWTMLLVLIGGFALSQAFRTAAAIMAPSLAQTFSLSPQQLGLFAAAFHFSFAGLQLFMGMAIDVYGPRRTIVAVFP